ncbi:MAG: GAF and ANTAR domain-containing protein [Lacisediminihabitans sp.]
MNRPPDSDADAPPGLNTGGADADLCSRFVEFLPITGASISVFDETGNQSTICASDEMAARLEEMQFELGEGPHWEALHTGRPVMVPDLHSESLSSWPMFSEAVRHTGVGAVFAFPLTLGVVTIGVVDLYCSSPGNLSASALATAVNLAGSVTLPAARMAIRSADREDASTTVGTAPELRRDVHQATGMILVQMNVSATEAFLLLRAHAFSSGRTVQEIAQDVVARRLDFSVAAE